MQPRPTQELVGQRSTQPYSPNPDQASKNARPKNEAEGTNHAQQAAATRASFFAQDSMATQREARHDVPHHGYENELMRRSIRDRARAANPQLRPNLEQAPSAPNTPRT